MRILIRRIQRDRKGKEALFESSVDGTSLSVGHQNDQTLQLLDPDIAAAHALLKAGRGGRFDLRCVGAARVESNGKSVQRARLLPGQSIEIGRQTLTVIAPPAGFDAAMEVVAVEQGESYGPVTHFVTDLDQAGLRPRRWALISVLLILLLTLALPLAGHRYPLLGHWLHGNALLASDAVWSSGPLSNAHHGPDIGHDCNVCHQRLFEPTPDRACRACHQDIQGHYPENQVALAPAGASQCANCHKEHNTPSNLVRADSGLCLDCHRDLSKVQAGDDSIGRIRSVLGFGVGSHPEFRLSLLRFDEVEWSWSEQREASDSNPGAQESSNLKFAHQTHLDRKKVHLPGSDQAPGCTDCHSLGSDGEHFQPITMEAKCRNCHSLAFDENEPLKQLPHADVAAALTALEEHFLRRQLAPAMAGITTMRRRPGAAPMADPCAGNRVACAEERAGLEAVNQFTRSGCVTCHQVKDQPHQPLQQRWRVKPVRLVGDWYPHARFNHAVHLKTSVSGRVGDQVCVGCHAADRSESSIDVLIPPLDRCLDCHGERAAVGIVRLDCSSCHAFHPRAERPPPAAAIPATIEEKRP